LACSIVGVKMTTSPGQLGRFSIVKTQDTRGQRVQWAQESLSGWQAVVSFWPQRLYCLYVTQCVCHWHLAVGGSSCQQIKDCAQDVQTEALTHETKERPKASKPKTRSMRGVGTPLDWGHMPATGHGWWLLNTESCPQYRKLPNYTESESIFSDNKYQNLTKVGKMLTLGVNRTDSQWWASWNFSLQRMLHFN